MTNSKVDWFACLFTITINPNAPVQVDPPQKKPRNVFFLFKITMLGNNSSGKQLVTAAATGAMVALPTNAHSGRQLQASTSAIF